MFLEGKIMMVICECPFCDYEINLQGYEEDDVFSCPQCHTRLEIVSLTPPVLEISPEEDEGWD